MSAKRILRKIVNVYTSSRDFTVTIRLECTHEYVYETGSDIGMDLIYAREAKRVQKRTRCQQCEEQQARIESYAPVE